VHPWRAVGRRSRAPGAQGPRVWRARQRAKLSVALLRRAPLPRVHGARARAVATEAVGRPHLLSVPGVGKGRARAEGWPNRWRGCAARARLRRVCGRGCRVRRGCNLGGVGRCGAGLAGKRTSTGGEKKDGGGVEDDAPHLSGTPRRCPGLPPALGCRRRTEVGCLRASRRGGSPPPVPTTPAIETEATKKRNVRRRAAVPWSGAWPQHVSLYGCNAPTTTLQLEPARREKKISIWWVHGEVGRTHAHAGRMPATAKTLREGQGNGTIKRCQ